MQAIIEDIKDCAQRGQPVLVGTTSIETSELISGMLRKSDIAHEVLNAKQHAREASIVAQAGRPGSVTIATNMAGRGTDIVLGGILAARMAGYGEERPTPAHEDGRTNGTSATRPVVEAGGVHIIGTERHESRRIDNQLRGRSGRQGDPGSSRFYLSLEDSLMRIFASDRMSTMMQRFGMKEDEAIEAGMLNRAIENAQRKVEAHNFDVRKHLLDYDNVANDQRRVIYQQRNELMEAEEIADTIADMRDAVFNGVIDRFIPQAASMNSGKYLAWKKHWMVNSASSFHYQWMKEDDQLHEASCASVFWKPLTRTWRERRIDRPRRHAALRKSPDVERA